MLLGEEKRFTGKQDHIRLGGYHFLYCNTRIACITLKDTWGVRRKGLRLPQIGFERVLAIPIGEDIGRTANTQQIVGVSISVESHQGIKPNWHKNTTRITFEFGFADAPNPI